MVPRERIDETSRAGTSPEDLIGSLVDGRYKVIEAMAAGSMGAVYKAERVPVGKLVAIKFLHASFANDSEFQTRFERETRVMSKLAHPNCVSVVDFGAWQGAPYIVMEYIAGTTLRSIIDRGALEPTRALAIARQIAAGLAHAHTQGITHRDVKPANIMISEEIGTGEHVRILDFGLARLRGAVGRDATQNNVVVGTPNYMAPEQTVGGGAIDARTDVYAVGVVLFEMVAGERPFQAEDTLALLGMHRAAPIPKLADRVGERVEIPEGLQAVVEKAMAKSPDDRYQSAIELADAISEIATLNSGILPRPPEIPGEPARKGRPIGKQPGVRKKGRTDIGIAPTMVDIDNSDEAIPVTPRPAKASSSKAGAVLAVLVLGGGAAAAWYVKGRNGDKPGNGTAVATASGSGRGLAHEPVGSGTQGEPVVTVGSGSQGSAVEPGSAAGSVSGSGSDAGSASGSGSASEAGSGSGSAATAGSGSGSAGSATVRPGSGSAAEIDMSAENVKQPEHPGAGSGTKADDEAADAPKDATEIEKKKPPPAPMLATTVDDAIKLIKDGKRELALASLRQMATQQPRNWYIPFVLGNLYFDQLWWGVAMDYYYRSISLNGAVRANGVLIRNVIQMLASSKTQKRAGEFLRFNIGKPATPYLQTAARSSDNPTIKKSAAQLLRVIR